jgi:tyrosine-protein kinase Etk/Wzc
LTVAVRKDTYAFGITYRSSDPKEAADVANMAAEIYLESSSDAHRSESAHAREFIAAQLEESGKALEQARAAILAYKDSGGTFELSSEYNEKLKNESDLENTLAKAEAKLAARRAADERIRLKDSPALMTQKAEIAELRGQISNLRVQLALYPKKETQMNTITLAQRLAEQRYEFYRKQYEEARAKEAATVTEIRIASRAVPSLYPVKPVKYVYAGLSFAVGLVAAIGWVLFSDSLDPRLRTIGELSFDPGLRTIGELDEEFEVPVGTNSAVAVARPSGSNSSHLSATAR